MLETITQNIVKQIGIPKYIIPLIMAYYHATRYELVLWGHSFDTIIQDPRAARPYYFLMDKYAQSSSISE